MISHSYKTRNNSLPATEERFSSPCETSEPIINLQKKILSSFDGLDKEQLSLKEVIIKGLLIENHQLC